MAREPHPFNTENARKVKKLGYTLKLSLSQTGTLLSIVDKNEEVVSVVEVLSQGDWNYECRKLEKLLGEAIDDLVDELCNKLFNPKKP